MGQPFPRTRSALGRVAMPIDGGGSSRPSLVPNDVWEAYQEELASGQVPMARDSEVVMLDPSAPVRRLGLAELEVALSGLAGVELFSPLVRERLETLARSSEQVECNPGGKLFSEGDDARSFYVVLDGTVEMVRHSRGREIVLRRLERGDAIGLFGLFYSRRRAAVCRAVTPAVLLEIPAKVLEAVLAQDMDFRSRMLSFYEHRLIEGFVGSSGLFAQMEPGVRSRLRARFSERRLAENETFVQPGEVVNLLAVVISGTVHLEQRPQPGQEPLTYEVLPGQYVGITSAFSGSPCRLRLYAPDETTVMVLSHRDLAELMREAPELRSLSGTLAQFATRVERDVFCGDTNAPGS